ncbi:MAG: hypothetical protein ABI632_13625 [Pseudolysinimonas sp.]
MTLSGKSDSRERAKAARAARQEREAANASKRPWLMPAIITVAVVVLVGGIIFGIVNGFFTF